MVERHKRSREKVLARLKEVLDTDRDVDLYGPIGMPQSSVAEGVKAPYELVVELWLYHKRAFDINYVITGEITGLGFVHIPKWLDFERLSPEQLDLLEILLTHRETDEIKGFLNVLRGMANALNKKSPQLSKKIREDIK